MKKLSILIPAYNEEKTIEFVLKELLKVRIPLEKEVIIINDGSTDGTKAVIENFLGNNKTNDVEFILINKPNGGKGSAVRKGIEKSTGDIIIIQDADMEYNPHEYSSLIGPILSEKAKVVYGSRSLKKSNEYSHLSFLLGGRLVTFMTNLLFFSKITDEPTCYKTFRADVIKNIELERDKFDWEPEVTAKILKKGIKIYEVPISYNPRHISEGKKIRWRDGLDAILTLIKYRFKD